MNIVIQLVQKRVVNAGLVREMASHPLIFWQYRKVVGKCILATGEQRFSLTKDD